MGKDSLGHTFSFSTNNLTNSKVRNIVKQHLNPRVSCLDLFFRNVCHVSGHLLAFNLLCWVECYSTITRKDPSVVYSVITFKLMMCKNSISSATSFLWFFFLVVFFFFFFCNDLYLILIAHINALHKAALDHLETTACCQAREWVEWKRQGQKCGQLEPEKSSGCVYLELLSSLAVSQM